MTEFLVKNEVKFIFGGTSSGAYVCGEYFNSDGKRYRVQVDLAMGGGPIWAMAECARRLYLHSKSESD